MEVNKFCNVHCKSGYIFFCELHFQPSLYRQFRQNQFDESQQLTICLMRKAKIYTTLTLWYLIINGHKRLKTVLKQLK